MPKLNRENISDNIRDARGQLEEIENLAAAGTPPSEVELQIKLEHALHHLSFAWNVRKVFSKNTPRCRTRTLISGVSFRKS